MAGYDGTHLESVPDDEEQFISEMLERCESDKFDPKKYDL